MSKRRRYHLVGVGGVGMCALAQALLCVGQRDGLDVKVQGSDRSFDRGERSGHFDLLKSAGIKLVTQNGAAIKGWLTAVVVSTAIEEDNPDIQAARALKVPILHRSELLADILHSGAGVAVAGTSGKSSTTAMLGHALAANWKDPLVIGGAAMLNFTDKNATGHVRCGAGPVVIEADESDGTLERYNPQIGLVSSITLDHKPLSELKPMFEQFVGRVTQRVVVHHSLKARLKPFVKKGVELVDYGIGEGSLRAWALRQDGDNLFFRVGQAKYHLKAVGHYNVLNALATTAAAQALGLSKSQVAQALVTYSGVERRFVLLGRTKNGVMVVDDYAHNPEKLKAALLAARHLGGRVALVFQPHGFGPTRLMKDALSRCFRLHLRKQDGLFLLPIYYAGGTVQRDICSEHLLPGKGPAHQLSMGGRPALLKALREWAMPGDVILLASARDPTLGELAQQIFQSV